MITIIIIIIIHIDQLRSRTPYITNSEDLSVIHDRLTPYYYVIPTNFRVIILNMQSPLFDKNNNNNIISHNML